jgi:aryl-alcohol dehydrogenase-like predicted oxidoreductase
MRGTLGRRRFLQWLGGLALAGAFTPAADAAARETMRRRIPSSGEELPVIGMGTWLTFDVGPFWWQREQRCEVLQTFLDMGGGLVDSSPMYGRAEEVLGACLAKMKHRDRLFAATKVWIAGRRLGIDQMERSRRLWGVKRFDLMQIHNMLDWRTHIDTLRQMKADGKIRYIGITTSHGRRHPQLEQVMASVDDFDFVQFTYNLVDRDAEKRLLPLAAERGLAVIVNRPFQGGALFDHVRGKPLPAWAAEFDCANWAQFMLKFIVSHPAVTCTIPATTQVAHMRENMGAASGRLPDERLRQQMSHYFASL